MKDGAIIIIDDDLDDLMLIKEGLKVLNVENEVIEFQNSVKAAEFLLTIDENPYLILCDVNMPNLDGYELRRRSFANDVIRLNTVPFLFLSTASDHISIKNAYQLSIQGYFVKPGTFDEIVEMLKNIIDYWNIARRPGF